MWRSPSKAPVLVTHARGGTSRYQASTRFMPRTPMRGRLRERGCCSAPECEARLLTQMPVACLTGAAFVRRALLRHDVFPSLACASPRWSSTRECGGIRKATFAPTPIDSGCVTLQRVGYLTYKDLLHVQKVKVYPKE